MALTKQLFRVGLGTAVMFTALAGAAPRPQLPALDQGVQAPRARVLVLGTVHLREMPEAFQRSSFARLNDKLAAFRPDVIAIERLSGESCDLAARHHVDMGRYCGETTAAMAATGLDVPAAIAEAQKLVRALPPKPTAQQRRQLAAIFMAANEEPSALVQWLQLPRAEQHSGDGLDETLVAMLEKAERSTGETSQISAPLAGRLGLARLVAMDDHSGDNLDIQDESGFVKALREAWATSSAEMRTVELREAALVKDADVLALYRYINGQDVRRIAARADFGAALAHRSPQRFGQMYVAGWETRNLRMAANIRAAFRERPGARVLVIVGAQHKPWLDALLGLMQGVDVVDVGEALK